MAATSSYVPETSLAPSDDDLAIDETSSTRTLSSLGDDTDTDAEDVNAMAGKRSQAALEVSNVGLLREIIGIADRLNGLERRRSHMFRNTPLDNMEPFEHREAIIILLAMSKKLKRGMIVGNISRLDEDELDIPPRHRDMVVPPQPGRLERPAITASRKKRPLIYVVIVADEHWKPPPIDHLREIVDKCDLYVRGYRREDEESSDSSKQVDSVVRTGRPKPSDLEAASGRRKYISNNQDRYEYRDWSTAVKQRMHDYETTEEYVKPSLLLRAVGYTDDPDSREQNHKNHASSYHLMNLVDAVAHRLWAGVYDLHFIPVYECMDERHPSLAEHIISMLFRSYHCFGGFNTHEGGRLGTEGAERVEAWVYNQLKLETMEAGHLEEDWDEENRRYMAAKLRRLHEEIPEQDEERERVEKELEEAESKRAEKYGNMVENVVRQRSTVKQLRRATKLMDLKREVDEEATRVLKKRIPQGEGQG